MKFSKSLKMAVSNIIANRTRSLLTMLGIIIGIMSVIVIISLMNGITGSITDQFSGMGTTSITVSLKDRGSSRQVTTRDIYAIAKENSDLIAGVSPSVNVNAMVRSRTDSETMTTRVSGVSEAYVSMANLTVAQGNFFQYVDLERLQNVCVVGTYIQTYLFGKTSALGETIKINGIPYEVIGVLEEKADSAKGSADECIYIPYTNATRINGNAKIMSFTLYAHSEETVDAAMDNIKDSLTNILGDLDYYSISSMKEMMDMMGSITGMLQIALVFIAGISLLVGGIGIMNIMLVTVTERTREIGIRKALGIKKRDILNQFIIEAATLSGIGGILGILVGGGLALLVGMIAGINATPTLPSVLLSVGVSTAIGIGFGYAPAKRAAALNPIDALKYE